MTLAASAGITVARTRIIPLKNGVAVAIRRFDRAAGARLHALSASVALKAAGTEFSYPNLALLLRRRGAVDGNLAQMHELFRRLVFNILIDNTDDCATIFSTTSACRYPVIFSWARGRTGHRLL